MFRTMMYSKIHMANVTEANLRYIGSITIDEDLLDATGIVENERVQVVNVSTGDRLETYVIVGERGSGVICLNGAAARLVQKGDEVIIIAYKIVPEEELSLLKPKIVFVDKQNKAIKIITKEPPNTSHSLVV
jgi:aspartate 1-decarboxylase